MRMAAVMWTACVCLVQTAMAQCITQIPVTIVGQDTTDAIITKQYWRHCRMKSHKGCRRMLLFPDGPFGMRDGSAVHADEGGNV